VPVTPLHLVGAWAFWLATGKRGSFVAFSLGAVLIDLEVPLFFALGVAPGASRGPLHSILGAFTLDVLLVAITMTLLVPPVWRLLERRWPAPRIYQFAGVDVRDEPASTRVLFASSVGGSLSHFWLDLPTHSFNPLLWPLTEDPLNFLAFSEVPLWEISFNLLLLIVLTWMVFHYWGALRPEDETASPPRGRSGATRDASPSSAPDRSLRTAE
jgi:membrane-bound metal-dependent hydrolase YbcI (DUF457 family)